MNRSSLFAIVAGLIFLPASAFAQGKAQIEKPTIDDLPSPEFSGGKNKAFRPKNWLEVEAKIRVPAQNADQKKVGFIDQITVKWYVAMKDHEKGATAADVLLTKDINHINVPVDEDIFSSVYISPSTLKRLTGRDNGGKMSVASVGVEVLVNGVKVAEETTKGKPGWWNSSSGLSRSEKFPLHNKNETPFKFMWWDRYAEIEERR